MPGMTFDPVPFHFVAIAGFIQSTPQVFVLDRFLVGGFPAAGFPAFDPFGHALHHVFAVSVQIHAAWTFVGLQSRNRRQHFHAVIGGVQFTAPQLFFMAARL